MEKNQKHGGCGQQLRDGGHELHNFLIKKEGSKEDSILLAVIM
jgi:hypothetical protein